MIKYNNNINNINNNNSNNNNIYICNRYIYICIKTWLKIVNVLVKWDLR